MTPSNIEAKRLIDCYVRGELDTSETEAFEIYFLDKPQLIADIEAAQALKRGLAHPPKLRVKPRQRWLQWVFQPSHSLPLAGAYAVLLCALGLSLLLHVTGPQDLDTSTEAVVLRNVPIYYLEVRRAVTDSEVVVRLADRHQRFLLSVDVFPPIEASYGIQIHDKADGRLIHDVKGLIANDDAISLVLDRSNLPVGNYRLRLFADDIGAGRQSPLLHSYDLSVRDL